MDNKDIEVLEDFELEDVPSVNSQENQQSTILNNQNMNENQEVAPIKPVTSEDEKKVEENPVIEMINNKTTIKLIAIMLIVLFAAVFLMPKVFELIGAV